MNTTVERNKYLRDNGKFKIVEHPFVPEVFYQCFRVFEYLNTTAKTHKWPTIKEKVELPNIFSLDMGVGDE